jgi:hypothetical protein
MAALTRKNSSRSSPDARDRGTTDDVTGEDGGVADGDDGEAGADTKGGVTLRHPARTANGLGVPATWTTGGWGALLFLLDAERKK